MHKLFGKYVLLEPIAAGGMAEVFKASLQGESGFERVVAIKCILPHLSEDEDFVSMFVDEAKIAVQLSHANIAQIIDLGVEEGRYYIALEYVHGKDLRAITDREEGRGGGVPISVACHLVMNVASALHHAHNASGRDGRPLGVIHRDVSPQNVLISFDGEVKVIDFGLAKAAGRATQTRAGVLKGKLAYLSPEQAMGDRIDHRSDIYALGICLHEMLTGRRLFFRETDIDTVLAVRAGVVPRPSQLASDVPLGLDAIVQRVLARDREHRYQSAMQLHDDLEAFVYETNNLLSRRQLSGYMRDLFPEEVLTEAELPELDVDDLLPDEGARLSEVPPAGDALRAAATSTAELVSRTMVTASDPRFDPQTTRRIADSRGASTAAQPPEAMQGATLRIRPDGAGTVELDAPPADRPPATPAPGRAPPNETVRELRSEDTIPAPAPEVGCTVPYPQTLEGLLGMAEPDPEGGARRVRPGDAIDPLDDDDEDDETVIM